MVGTDSVLLDMDLCPSGVSAVPTAIDPCAGGLVT
jgi:hypothetical protein